MKSRPPKYVWFLILVVLAGIVVVPLAAQRFGQEIAATPTISAPETIQQVRQYDLFEVRFQVPGTYANPYNPDEIAVDATFVGPEDQTLVVPGFAMQGYRQTCFESCPDEALETIGTPDWRVRFSPPTTGRWTYTITVHNSSGLQDLMRGALNVTPSTRPGYIHVGSNPRYFAFDNGSPYFPVGENLAWSFDGMISYTHWLNQLNAAGANYARVYIDVPWFISLDWAGPVGNYEAAQTAAWRMDTLLRQAEARGIYLQVVLIWHQGYADYVPPTVGLPANTPDISADWDSNPLNSANGGPLSGPSAIFIDSNARDLLRQRLRYIVARWGYSPSILAWEITDEVDQMTGYTPERAQTWLHDLSSYLREIDPYQHLITAGARQPDTAIWQLTDLDFAQVQLYQARPTEQSTDQVALTMNALSQAFAYTHGPVLLSEFSINPWYGPSDDDPTGVHIQTTIWSAAMSGAAGGAMSWWWDSYVENQNLYSIYTPLALFSQGIPWNTSNLQPVAAGVIADTAVTYGSLHIDDFNRDFLSTSPTDTIYRLTSDGSIPPSSLMSAYLYGAANPERSFPQTLIAAPPVDTELNVYVQNVSASAAAQLAITIDGLEAARVDFSPNNEGVLITVPLRAGEHTITLDNQGQDWLQLGYIEIPQYRAPLRALALADQTNGIAVAWVHHRDYTWEMTTRGGTLDPLTFRLWLPNMPAGTYRISYWDTDTGAVIGEENATLASDGTLYINLLPVSSQLAVSAFRVAAPETNSEPPTPLIPTRTPQVSLTPTATDTATATATTPPTETATSTETATATDTATSTITPTSSDTPEVSNTPEATDTLTQTPRPTRTPNTPLPTVEITDTPSTFSLPPRQTRTPGPNPLGE